MLTLPKISDEQYEIIKILLNNKNVIVNSVAGSGKTTSILHIATTFDNLKILTLTYNKRLKIDSRYKIRELNLKNIEIHSYHSFCFKYYDKKCITDQKIKEILKMDVIFNIKFNYDMIIIDEAQDLTLLYYELIQIILHNNKSLHNKNTYICIFGDYYQSIFEFNNADPRFIKYANEIFNVESIIDTIKTTQNSHINSDKEILSQRSMTPKPKELLTFGKTNNTFIKTSLSTSFRLTIENANFINICLLKENRINAIKNGSKPRYLICDSFGNDIEEKNMVYREVIYYLKNYTYDDIFILAPSIKSEKSPIRKLANLLSNNNIPIYVPNNDDEKLDDDILNGKIIFSTFHQSKGLERKVVIVFGFDNSYFHFFKKNNNPFVCPNEIYVATTRCIECLSLIHHYNNDYLSFINENLLSTYCDVFSNLKKSKKILNKKRPIIVTELTKHLPHTILNMALQNLKITKINDKQNIIDIPIKIKEGELFENVSEITGVAIPAYYEYITTNNMSIYNDIKNISLCNVSTPHNDQKINMNIKPIEHDNKRINNFNLNLSSSYLLDSDDDDEIYSGNKLLSKKQKVLFESPAFCEAMEVSQKCENFIVEPQIKSSSKLTLNNKFEKKVISLSTMTINELLYIANEYCASKSGYIYKLNQINNYNWLTTENLNKCIERMKFISKNAKYEIDISMETSNDKIIGCVDCMDNNIVYEFKCVSELKEEHFIQLAIYQYMIENKIQKQKNDLIDEINEIKHKINNNKNTHKNDNTENLNAINKVYKHPCDIFTDMTQNSTITFVDKNNSHNCHVKIYKNGNFDLISDDKKFKKKIKKNEKNYTLKNTNGKIICEMNNSYIEQYFPIISNGQTFLVNKLNDCEKKLKNIETNVNKYILFNILTNEMFDVSTSYNQLMTMVEYLIYIKYYNNFLISDEQFIQNSHNIVHNILKHKHNIQICSTQNINNDSKLKSEHANEIEIKNLLPIKITSDIIIFYDLETNGLIKKNIIPDILQICIMDYITENILYYDYVYTNNKISIDATKINNITNNDVKNAPSIVETTNKIQNILKKYNNIAVFAHNGNMFDHIIAKNINLFTNSNVEYYDTLTIIKKAFNNFKSYSLKNIYFDIFGYNFINSHDAHGDTLALIHIIKKLNILYINQLS